MIQHSSDIEGLNQPAHCRAYFEAIAIGIQSTFSEIQSKNPVSLREKVTELVQTEAFRAVTGPGANSKEKLRIRIQLATDALLSAV